MAIGESARYARDFFYLDYPAEWLLRESKPLGLTSFHDSTIPDEPYPTGIALMTLPETGVSLEKLLGTGLFLITRDLENPVIERAGEVVDGDMVWTQLLVQGRAPGTETTLDIVKHVAITRPGPGILVLALYGSTEKIAALSSPFEALRRSVQIVR